MQLFFYMVSGHESIFYSRAFNTDEISEGTLKNLTQLYLKILRYCRKIIFPHRPMKFYADLEIQGGYSEIMNFFGQNLNHFE